jgi:hypothetical protein
LVTLTIDAPATVPAGSDFVATLNFTQAVDFNAFQFQMAFNPAVIQVTGAEGGSGVMPGLIGTTAIPLDGWTFSPPLTPSGTISVIGHLAGAAAKTGSGYLVKVNFHVNGSAGQQCEIITSELKMFTNQGNTIFTSGPAPRLIQIGPP